MMKTGKITGGNRMGKKYSPEERQEALKLADEIGTAAAA